MDTKQVSPKEIATGLYQYHRAYNINVQCLWAFAAIDCVQLHTTMWTYTVWDVLTEPVLGSNLKMHTDMTTGWLLLLLWPSSSSHCPRNPS